MKKKILSIAICFVMVVGLLAGTVVPVFAHEEYDGGNVKLDVNPEFDLSDFEYETLGSTIYLNKYNGDAEDIFIPEEIKYEGEVYKVRLKNDCSGFFKQNESIKTISFENDTSNVTDMSEMFKNCYSLTSVTGLKTGNCKKMSSMFYNCLSLTDVDTSGFDTSGVTDMSRMFDSCMSITTIDVTGFDTSNVTSMNGMFNYCRNLTDIDVSGFDTSSIEGYGLGNVFRECLKVKELDVSDWNLKNATSISSLFDGCQQITTLDLSNWDLSNATITTNMLLGCKNLQSIEIPLNLKVDTELHGEFVSLDNPYEIYTSLPMEQEKSFTIIRTAEREGNIISIDYEAGTAVVHDDVLAEGERTVPLATIDEGYVYRMYDPTRGEHFYTKDYNEMQSLVENGWNHEAESDFVAVDARDVDAMAVYRLYNPNNGGMHFYTDSADEVRNNINSGWTYEGISFYSFDKDSKKGTPQYRTYNPNSTNGEHNWTTNVQENEGLIAIGWVDEDVCWNVLEDDGARSKEIVGSFRYIDPDIPELVCTYTFNADGTGTYDIAGEVQKLTYAIYGNELSIMFEGHDIPMNVEFTVDAEALTIVDGTGAYMVYYRI